MLEKSEEIGKLVLALSQAQAEITGARKNSKNPFYKSAYSDLASCWDACRTQLAKHKLAVIQTTDYSEHGIAIVTTLAHESGQFITGRLVMKPAKNDPQGYGSAITYGRRYALSAIVGLAQVDDDGNEASRPARQKKQISRSQVKKINDLLKQTKSDLPSFLKFAKAKTVENIIPDMYKTCINALESKLGAEVTKEAEPVVHDGFVMCPIPKNGQVPASYCSEECPEKDSCKAYLKVKND